MNKTYLSLGSNEDDRIMWLKKAIELITINCGTIESRSDIYETAAWGMTEQPDFLNMVIGVHTHLSPAELLNAILKIELTLGRKRDIKWGPRTIDIDILFYNNIVLEAASLVIPHPFLQERRFILTPLSTIAPDFTHPKLNKTIRELLAECKDTLTVNRYLI